MFSERKIIIDYYLTYMKSFLKPHHQIYTIDAIHSRTYYCRNSVSRVCYVIGLRVIVFQVSAM